METNGERNVYEPDFEEFIAEYPDVDAKDIPVQVWMRVRGGESLAAAYRKYENANLKEENERLVRRLGEESRAEKNRRRSAGSQRGTGGGKRPEGWEREWYED